MAKRLDGLMDDLKVLSTEKKRNSKQQTMLEGIVSFIIIKSLNFGGTLGIGLLF